MPGLAPQQRAAWRRKLAGQVGDRWSLLVIRDLLTGAKKLTDLMDRLGGITPMTLSQRLRELEDAGIVSAATTQSLTILIFAGSDVGIDITGETGAVQRFRQLVSALATVVHPV